MGGNKARWLTSSTSGEVEERKRENWRRKAKILRRQVRPQVSVPGLRRLFSSLSSISSFASHLTCRFLSFFLLYPARSSFPLFAQMRRDWRNYIFSECAFAARQRRTISITLYIFHFINDILNNWSLASTAILNKCWQTREANSHKLSR